MTETREEPLSTDEIKGEIDAIDPPTLDNALAEDDAPTLVMGAEHISSKPSEGMDADPEFFSEDAGGLDSKDESFSVEPLPGIEDVFAQAVEAVEAVKAEVQGANSGDDGGEAEPEQAVEMEILGPEDEDDDLILEDEEPSLNEAQTARIEELEEQLAATEKAHKALNSRFLRTAADYENFRKRSQREKEETRKFGSERLLMDFLPVIDNLERAIQHVTVDENADKSFTEGVVMVLRQFEQQLKKHGVEGFDSEGKKFDPQFHEAVQQVKTTEHPTGTVMSEFQRGYVVHERLLRPALVVVAHNPGGVAPSEQDSSEEPEASSAEGVEENEAATSVDENAAE